jgi:adhesin/invasin
LLSYKAVGRYSGGITYPIYFGAQSKVSLSHSAVPADGTSSVKLVATALESSGRPIVDIPVTVSTPDSFATVTVAEGVTDAQGKFITEISNTVPQLIQVRTTVGGVAFVNPISFTSTASTDDGNGGSAPIGSNLDRIDVLVVSNNIAPNARDQASVVVVARNQAGVPIRNLPIGVSSNSGTAILSVPNGETGQFFVLGNTGATGSFTVNLSNTKAETVKLTAAFNRVSTEEESVISSEDIEIIFQNVEASAGVAVTEITLEAPIQNPTPAKANGRDTITLSGMVKLSDGKPAAGVSVSLISSGGSARFPANVTTNQAGLFFATFTNSIAESFTVRGVVGSVSSTPATLTFVAVPETPAGEVPVVPSSLSLLVSPAQQEVGKSTTLTVIARDSSQSPLAGVALSVSARGGTSNSAIFDFTGELVTGTNGTVTFGVNNSQQGSFDVTVTAKNGGLSATQQVTFVPPDTVQQTVPATLTLLSNIKQAVINEPIQLTAIALNVDQSPLANVKLRVSVAGATGNSAVFDFAQSNELTTSANGTVTFAVTNPIAGLFDVVAVAIGGGPTATQTLSFTDPSVTVGTPVARLDVSVRNNNQAADGSSEIIVEAVALTASGEPIPDANITLLTDSGNAGATLINPAKGKTNPNGYFTAAVTSSTAGTVKLTVLADNLQTNPPVVELNFTASSQVNPDSIELRAEPAQQVANGAAGIVLVATPRDARGVAIAGIEVEILVTSSNFAELSFPLPSGQTNAIGEYRAIITSSKADTFTLKPVVKNVPLPEAKSRPITVEFTAVTGRELQQLVLNVVDNQQNAGIANFAKLLTLARASDGSPLGDIPVILRVTPAPNVPNVADSVIFQEQTGFQGKTSVTTGVFETGVSNPQAGTFQVQAFEALDGGRTGIASNAVLVTFTTPAGGVPDVESLTILTDRVQIPSAGKG